MSKLKNAKCNYIFYNICYMRHLAMFFVPYIVRIPGLDIFRIILIAYKQMNNYSTIFETVITYKIASNALCTAAGFLSNFATYVSE